LDESIMSGSVDEEDMTGSMLEADDDVESTLDDEVEGESTQVIDLAVVNAQLQAEADFQRKKSEGESQRQRDLDGEVITGMKGLSLEREDSDDKKV
jgi:phosphatidate phosphatase LPIN